MFGSKKAYFILVIVWLVIQLGLLLHNGIVTNGEAIPYIHEADYFIANATFTSAKFIFYSVYILLLALFQQTGIQAIGVYVVQAALNLYAMHCFFKLTNRVTKNNTTAFFATVLLIICIPWQDWTTYLYTESMFCSIVIIFSYSLFHLKRKSKTLFAFALILFLLLLFSRPTGLLFIPVTALLFVYRWIKKGKIFPAILTISIAAFLFIILVNYAMQGGGEFDFMKPFRDENILCYLPTQTTSADVAIPKDGNSLQALLFYVMHNPAAFIHLAFLKFQSYWGLTRSYYSSSHNLLLMCFFYPLYFFAFIGLLRFWRSNGAFTLYVCAIIFFFTLSVLVTCDDWSNRFIMPVLPFIIIFGTNGIITIINRLKSNSAKN